MCRRCCCWTSPATTGKSAFLVFFLVFVVQTCMMVQHLVGRWLRRRPLGAAQVSRELLDWAQLGSAALVAGSAGRRAAVLVITPFKPGAGAGDGADRLRRRLAGRTW